MTEERTIIEESGGHFYAKEATGGWVIYKDGGQRRYSDGTTRLGMHVPVLAPTEWIAQESHQRLCEEVAAAMNAFEASS